MKNQWRLIIGLLLVLIVVIFAVLNNQTVPVSFGFVEIKGPLILIILGSAIIGAVGSLLTSTASLWSQKKQVKELKKELEEKREVTEKEKQQEIASVHQQYEAQLAELQEKYDELLAKSTEHSVGEE